MKIIIKMAIMAIIILISYSGNAQIQISNRQNYFTKYAERLPANVSELEKAFSTEEGRKVKINFGNFAFFGIVTSSVKRYENLQSIVIKSPDLNNTLLAISRRINEDKTISYVTLAPKSPHIFHLFPSSHGSSWSLSLGHPCL